MIDVRGWPVMKKQCSTCPFRPGSGDPQLAVKVIQRTMNMYSQICHHPVLHGKPENRLCRGARDLQLKVLVGLGKLPEATDKAFNEKVKELGL